jgi:enterochelin esterase-like enzyme
VPDTATINGVTGRGVRIYLPRGYALHPQRRYPVLYMHDGQNVFAPGGPFGCWFAENAVNLLVHQGRLRELIIVAVDNSPHRPAEYVPELADDVVSNADYNSFLINELKPYVDANYRTLVDAQHTGVMGSSFGGIASLVLGLEHGDVFGRVAAMSPSFWVGATGSKVAAGRILSDVRLYFDSGDSNDGQELTLQTRDAVLKTGRVLRDDFYYTVGFNQQHNEAAWSARLPEALQFLFPIAEEPNALEVLLPPNGDLNGDGTVDQADLGILLADFGCESGRPGSACAGDVDGDGATGQADLGALLGQFGATCNE